MPLPNGSRCKFSIIQSAKESFALCPLLVKFSLTFLLYYCKGKTSIKSNINLTV
jgi:hypothetical protein